MAKRNQSAGLAPLKARGLTPTQICSALRSSVGNDARSFTTEVYTL
jgi:hypothetical protein